MIAEIILILIFSLLGLLFMAIGKPLADEKIPRNNWYGFRTADTLASDEIWYPANKSAGKGYMVVGMITLIGSVAQLFFLSWLTAKNVVEISLGLFLLSLCVAMIKDFYYLSKLRKAKQNSDSEKGEE